jgi:hypothetical protein
MQKRCRRKKNKETKLPHLKSTRYSKIKEYEIKLKRFEK